MDVEIVTLRKSFLSSPWRRAFADALIKLRPDINPDAADELSDSAWGALSRLQPDEAAASCATTLRLPSPPTPSPQKSA